MSTVPSFGDSDPQRQLARTRELTRLVRRTQRATWFPLIVFAAVTFLAAPVHLAGHPSAIVCRSVAVPYTGSSRQVCAAHNSATFVYWPIALVVAYIVIATYYILQSRRRGVGSRIHAYVIAGVALTLVVTAASIWAAHSPPIGQYDILGWHLRAMAVYRFLGPGSAIGFGLLVLALVERNLPLFAVTVCYLGVALVPIDFGWVIAPPSRWSLLPHLIIDGGMLFAAGLAFALIQRPLRRTQA
jgi:hypothetical protein